MSPVRHMENVAELTGSRVWRSRRNVPIVSEGRRNACYFGKCHSFALFENGNRKGWTHSSIGAALFLLKVGHA